MFSIKPFHRRVLFLFAVYLFFAVAAIAFDPHGALPSKTCAICFMSGSLFSAIGQAYVLPEVFCNAQYAVLIHRPCECSGPVTFSGLSYRGPPLTVTSF